MYDVFTNDADSLLQKFFRRIFIGLKVMHVLLFMFSFYNTRTHILVYYFHSNTVCNSDYSSHRDIVFTYI